MVPLQMELSGKDACIILKDADLDLAASNIVKGGFSYRWGTCKNFIVLVHAYVYASIKLLFPSPYCSMTIHCCPLKFINKYRCTLVDFQFSVHMTSLHHFFWCQIQFPHKEETSLLKSFFFFFCSDKYSDVSKYIAADLLFNNYNTVVHINLFYWHFVSSTWLHLLWASFAWFYVLISSGQRCTAVKVVLVME